MFGYVGYALVAWVLAYIYSCTPERWTSFDRVMKETTVRVLMPLITLNPKMTIDGTVFDCDPKVLLPMEPSAPYIIMPADTPVQVAIDTLAAAWKRQDAIVVWKGFSKGTSMDKYTDEAFCRETFNDDEYDFLVNASNLKYETKNLKSAIDNMENHYLGFSYTLLNNNNNTLLTDFIEMLKSYGEQVTSLIPVFTSLHHAFLYKGKTYHTGVHQAPISDWFFQISNSKTWRFVHPKYTPYIKPVTWDGVSVMSGFDYLPDDCGIPYVDVTTDAGDMMFFPAHWWHEVHNNYDGWGLAFGFRPKADFANALFDAAFPLLANTGVAAHRLLFLSGIFKQAAAKLLGTAKTTTQNSGSGLKGRIEHLNAITKQMNDHIPGWTWDNFPVGTWGAKPAPGSCAA